MIEPSEEQSKSKILVRRWYTTVESRSKTSRCDYKYTSEKNIWQNLNFGQFVLNWSQSSKHKTICDSVENKFISQMTFEDENSLLEINKRTFQWITNISTNRTWISEENK